MARRRYGWKAKKTAASNGVVCDSAGEARRYSELLLLERCGDISDLRRQVKYPLEVNGVLVGFYTADFVYAEGGREVVEDYKGAVRTPDYALRANLFFALYGKRVKET